MRKRQHLLGAVCLLAFDACTGGGAGQVGADARVPDEKDGSPSVSDAPVADVPGPESPASDAGARDVFPNGARALNANDVSVLFPRTGATTASTLWPPTLAGKGGPLIPLATYSRIGRSVFTGFFGDGGQNQLLAPSVEYEKIRVVAVRFDPCFGAPVCQPQVRLVLQAFNAAGAVMDGAVHLLYNLTDGEFRSLLGELRGLTALAPENTADLPLGPSPALLAQGAAGPYGTALRALVSRYAGAGNLARMTFMTRTPSGNATWEFGGLNLKFFTPEGELSISGLPPNTRLQTVARPTAPGEYVYSVRPEPIQLAAILPVIDATKAKAASPEMRAAAYQALVRVENPTLETPESADCASCHIANRIRRHLDETYPDAVSSTAAYSGLAEARRFVGAAEKDDSNLRAFGHFDSISGAMKTAVVSQRTANETHRVLQTLAAM